MGLREAAVGSAMWEEGGMSRRYSLRRRKRVERSLSVSDKLERLLDAAGECKKILVFSGSGLSATTGVSMFSTKGGLYERAQKKMKVQDGKSLFTYPFYLRNKDNVQAFFVDIFTEVLSAHPSASHVSLASLHACGALQRHYTMNIDGLASAAGMDTWHYEENPRGSIVEMHGNIRQLVCPECCHVVHLDKPMAKQFSLNRSRPCPKCEKGTLRFKIMLYNDEEGECVVGSDEMWELLEKDLSAVDMILWVGISFEQSASVEYFRKVRSILVEQRRMDHVKQVLVNPSKSAMWNLLSATSNIAEMDLLDVMADCDLVLPELATKLRKAPHHQHEQHVLEAAEGTNLVPNCLQLENGRFAS